MGRYGECVEVLAGGREFDLAGKWDDGAGVEHQLAQDHGLEIHLHARARLQHPLDQRLACVCVQTGERVSPSASLLLKSQAPVELARTHERKRALSVYR
jgi:hypothetical protein